MLGKLQSTITWLPHYLAREMRRTLSGMRAKPEHVYFCICDHYEPYWNGADRGTAKRRIKSWLDRYPRIADRYCDSEGRVLKYSFFYPEEEYRKDDLDALAGLCHAGYGEVEIHLHHDNDTSDNLRRTLTDFKRRLHEEHGLLGTDPATGEITYGFIHGNWSLCNSRRDGRWCGVNDEIRVLTETGCYADFTLPSVPSETQTRKVNSIYYAVDVPGSPKSHDWGEDVRAGTGGEGLLMVQGPLGLDWGRRKFGVLPRVENGGLMGNFAPSPARMRLWIDAGVSVQGAPGHVFVKLHTHGAQENVMRMLFDNGGFVTFFESIAGYRDTHGVKVHFLSAREMVQRILGLRGEGATT